MGIFQIGEDGRITRANQALCTILGYENPRALTRLVTDFYRQVLADSARREDLLQQLERFDVATGFEIVCRRQNGQTIYTSMSVRNVRNGAHALLHQQGILEDISERKQLEEYRIAKEVAEAGTSDVELGRGYGLLHVHRNPGQTGNQPSDWQFHDRCFEAQPRAQTL